MLAKGQQNQTRSRTARLGRDDIQERDWNWRRGRGSSKREAGGNGLGC